MDTLVKALKASGGPSKLTVAADAWRDSSFHAPNKAEIIVEWILHTFKQHPSSILDLGFWNLLWGIISSPDPQPTNRPINVWLANLLNRVSAAPLLLTLLKTSVAHASVCRIASSCFDVIWPLTVHKIPTEATLECFGALLGALRGREADEGIARLGMLTVSTYRTSFHRSSNRKKIHAHFVQQYMDPWIESIMHQHTEPLNHALYQAGIETLFHSEIHAFRLEGGLFQAIKSIFPSNVQALPIIPRLFASLIAVLKKSSSRQRSDTLPAADWHDSGMQFYAACKSLLDDGHQATETWPTKIALLSLVDEEKLFVSNQTHYKALLDNDLEKAIMALESTDHRLARYAVEVISALARIDYDLVIPKLPRILPKILLAQGSMQSYLTLLDLLLTYHSKTRKIDTYIDLLFSTFSCHDTTSALGRPHQAYQLSLTGPLFQITHMKQLSTAIQRFLVDSQASKTVGVTFEFLTKVWEQLHSRETRVEVPDSHRGEERSLDERTAVVFSLSAHFAVIVLSSLPLQSISRANREQLDQHLKDIRHLMQSITRKSLKMILKTRHESVWPNSIVAVASLRLQYALDGHGTVPSSQGHDVKYYNKLLEVFQVDDLLPELRLEVTRLLLSRTLSREASQNRLLIAIILEELVKFSSSKALWSTQLSPSAPWWRTEGENILALFHMVIDRWLPTIESLASYEQLQRLVEVMLAVNTTDYSQSLTALQGGSVILPMLHSAHFWELPNLRNVFSGYLSQTLSALDQSTVDQNLIESISAYRLLLLVPMDCITRSSWIEFTRRALLADKLITSSPNHSERTYQDLTILRTFLARGFCHGHGTEPIQNHCDTLQYLMSSTDFPHKASETFYSATLELVGSLFLEVFKASEKLDSEAVLGCLQGFGQLNLHHLRSEKPDLRLRGFLRMISVLERSLTSDGLSKDLYSAMCELRESISKHVLCDLSAAGNINLHKKNISLAVWSSLLSFGKWLRLTNNIAPTLGKELLSKSRQLSMSHPSSELAETTSILLDILLQELHYCSEGYRLSQLGLIVAAYWSLSGKLESIDRRRLDDLLSKAYKVLSVPEFTHLLNLGSELLACSESPEERRCVVELSSVLLRDHPKSTLKYVQSFSSRCLNTFAAWHDLIDSPVGLRLQTLQFLTRHCAERPSILRLVDMSSIWTLLSRFLSGSRAHDPNTASDIFIAITTIIGAIIRLRRDLVVLTLPHLGTVLRQLMGCVRRLRPHLGAKQSALVTDMQPRWLNATDPMGVEAAKALSRVLEALATKTVIRSNTTNSDTQKAESLAKPFSKHAASVVKAYVEATSHPLCLIPHDVRKELQSGLYTLCGMVSDHGRDALMVSIQDAGGKSTLKTLWKGYEKQRYVGKG